MLLLTHVVPASAQTPVYVDVSQCRNISVDLVRVACYDSLADQALGGVPAASVTENVPAQNPEPSIINRQLQEENWRMREQLARQRKDQEAGNENEKQSSFGLFDRDSSDNEEDEDRKELYDKIAALQKTPDGWIVTLANGQIWRQMETRRYNLREGQEVRIYPSIWGKSYRLTVSELGSFIQVERVK